MASIVWKGFISFGLVSFPVRLYSAARAEAVHFHLLHRKDLSRVKEVWYCAEEDKPIDRADMVRGYEVSKGKYVVIEDAELKSVAPPTATTMDIQQFVAAGAVDPIYFERSYYVAGEEKVSKPFVLFLDALKETKRCAIAKLTMHGRENMVLLRPTEDGLVLHTLFYPDELHAANKRETAKGNTRKELDLAKSLIEQLSGEFEPAEMHDAYRENVERLIEQKSKGQKVTAIRQPKSKPVTDLMEALQQSLRASKDGTSTKKSKTKVSKGKAIRLSKVA